MNVSDRRLVMAYADPPYPGLARKYYKDHRDFGGEVDHRGLLSSLEERRTSGEIAGWALSTSSRALQYVLALMPASATPEICSWHKLVGPGDGKRHDFWEPLIVVPGRPWRQGFQNVLCAATARGGHEKLTGRKPILFCAWLFDALGMSPGDELLDLFPGTGGVSAAWSEMSSKYSEQLSGAGVAGVLEHVATVPEATTGGAL